MIILFIWITITIILILILLSQLKLSVHNVEYINYVRINFLMFTVDLDYSRFMKTLKRFSVSNNLDLKSQLSLYKALNPVFMDMAKQTTIEKAKFYKFFDEYNRTYEIITSYLLSSYLNSFLQFNCKKLKNYSYDVLYSDTRADMDFTFICNIRLFSIFFILMKNIKILFKLKKEKN